MLFGTVKHIKGVYYVLYHLSFFQLARAWRFPASFLNQVTAFHRHGHHTRDVERKGVVPTGVFKTKVA